MVQPVTDETPSIDSATFRRVLGNYPTGVTVVAGIDGGPVGMVIGSFGSVSLDPPLVQFMPGTGSSTWPRIERSGSFSVNICGAHQEDLVGSFFVKETDPFDAADWRPGPTGSPLIEGCIGWIDCRIGAVHEAGDHYIVIGEVVAMECEDGDAAPLVFYRGGYGTFAQMAED